MKSHVLFFDSKFLNTPTYLFQEILTGTDFLQTGHLVFYFDVEDPALSDVVTVYAARESYSLV